jgi:molecular chaperone DnaK
MLGDSLEYAFEDMDERIFTEAKIKADEMLTAVSLALEQLADEIPAQVRDDIAQLTPAVQAALESRSTADLKSLLKQLDEITEPLAAALLEKALA